MSELLKTNDDTKIHKDSEESMSEKPNLHEDWLNFFILIMLYVIQGFPVGLSNSIPIMLQSKKMVTYEGQAVFSFAMWPFCMKILWAPVIDALYIKQIGRRKSWLLPLQLLMGSIILYLANNIDDWLPETGKPNLKMLVMIVLVINFLAATQDIVVDGWSLTMLKKKNVSYASVCNTVGVPLGIFIGHVCFTLSVSEDFGNKYFRTTPASGGLMTMKSFLYMFGTISLLITILIGIFKKEKKSRSEDGYVRITVTQNFILLWNIIKLPRIRVLAIILLTTKICFAAPDCLSNLKLIDAGVPKESIMLISTVMFVIKLFMPYFVSKYITGPKPMSFYLRMTPIRLLWSITFAVMIHYTPSLIPKHENVNSITIYYYFGLGFIILINEMLSNFMTLAICAFFCNISDPRFGGTYMTLFNTFYYIGFLMSNTLVLKLVNMLTFSECSNDTQNRCHTQDFKNLCLLNGGSCRVYLEGYYIVTTICIVLGFVWYGIFRNTINKYQSLSRSHWMVKPII